MNKFGQYARRLQGRGGIFGTGGGAGPAPAPAYTAFDALLGRPKPQAPLERANNRVEALDQSASRATPTQNRQAAAGEMRGALSEKALVPPSEAAGAAQVSNVPTSKAAVTTTTPSPAQVAADAAELSAATAQFTNEKAKNDFNAKIMEQTMASANAAIAAAAPSAGLSNF
jgi:hypothetical protein